MKNLWEQLSNHFSFFAICILIIAALITLAKIAEHFLRAKRDIRPTRRITIISACAAIAAVLHVLDFPLLFLAPEFYKLDFSELPVMLCGFYIGPSAAVTCEAVKILLKLLVKGTSTAFVGDFANFVIGCSLVLPATILYHLRKSRKSAIGGLCVGTFVLTVFGSIFNAIYLLPKFSELFGLPLQQIVAMGNTINGSIHSVSTFVLFAVAPLNLIKGLSVSVLTMLLYKRIARPLFNL